MSFSTFDELLAIVSPRITLQDTNMRFAIPAVQRLAVTLRRLESGQIELPQPEKVPNDLNGKAMPFMLIGYEAFALSEHVLRPYPSRNLTVQQRFTTYVPAE
ncbi:hypothetical protein EVAR_2539_1 [Eumeta japonica]|uniref:Uncharacterized protein n=1 Tax=Eumeta variegata TaxID=151549 RepID=A0A4C1SS23_EUMVA|nr:hypothetical protein EVAR_2539_1 [Eumeta japonica]